MINGSNRSVICTLLVFLFGVVLLADGQALRFFTRDKCSRQCPCYYSSLFCKGYGRDSLPSDISPDVENVDFQDNRLSIITNDTFADLKQLKKLLLGNNNISYISEDAFSKQSQLNSLDLSDNKLSEISLSALDPVRKRLEHLSLLGNDISQIEGMFKHMRILKTLNLKHNHINVVTAETFFENRKLKYLQLASNSITYISPQAFSRQKDLEYLYLDNNHLYNMTTLNIVSKKLGVLSMSYCGLSVIPEGLSKGIRQLNLAGNEIKAIEAYPLSRLKLLVSIDLSNNQIATIDRKSLKNLDYLQILYLSGNEIVEFPSKLPPNLEELTLDYNGVSQLPKSALKRTPSLRKLSLSNNMIEYVHKKALTGLYNLTDLDLSHNVIGRLNYEVFVNLQRLRTLDISSNPFYLIEDGVLDGLVSLDSLNINNLGSDVKMKGMLIPDSPDLRILGMYGSESIAKGVFKHDLMAYNLRSVEYLNVMNDNLRELQPTFPQYLPKIRRIQLSNNPWNCNRDLYWLSRWISSGQVEEPHLTYIYCATPPQLKGRQLVDLDPFDWTS